ncbi:HNH endonuclease signature motif containing protein [Streptomyces sp. NPDC006879]|uniref:HNH endonuclease signature motif containing protein n=1 Tax=Streptomyces sp. NPDC006879 TaxID=3364767 RepID=UPI003682F313
MPEGRPAIPEPLKREVLVEAGHRCAIPTCRRSPVQIAHIEPWAKVRVHEFHNLVPLCGYCHDLEKAGQIDRKSLRQYKANLGLLSSRYGDYERRVLTVFGVQQGDIDSFTDGPYFVLPRGRELDLWCLIHDRMIEPVMKHGDDCGRGIVAGDVTFRFTADGRDLVRRLRDAHPIE